MVKLANSPSNSDNKPMLQSQQAPDNAEGVTNKSVAEEAYKELTRSMMADEIHIGNPSVILNMLETALRNRNVPISKHYIEELRKNIHKENVLDILSTIGKWIVKSECERQQANFEPSAPPLVDNDEERSDDWMIKPLSLLRDDCLDVIKKNGDFIMKQHKIEELNYKDLEEIVHNDMLLVSKEMVVYTAIIRWCKRECERKKLDPEQVNLKDILQGLVYAPRYGLMSEKEFLIRAIDNLKGPDRIGILSERETNEILQYIKQREKKKKDLIELPHKWSQKRGIENVQDTKTTTKERCFINFLSCWTTVFD